MDEKGFLEDLEIVHILVLLVGVEIDLVQLDVACCWVLHVDTVNTYNDTVNRIDNLAQGRPRPHLLNLCIIGLQQIINPRQQLGTTFRHLAPKQ